MTNASVFVLDNCQWPLKVKFCVFIYPPSPPLSLPLSLSLSLSLTSSFWRTEAIYYKADFYCTSIESLGEFCNVLLVSPSLQRCIVFLCIVSPLCRELFCTCRHSEWTANRSNKQLHAEPYAFTSS